MAGGRDPESRGIGGGVESGGHRGQAPRSAMGPAPAGHIPDAKTDMMEAGRASDAEFGSYLLQYVVRFVNLSPERIKAAMKRTGTEPEKVDALVGATAQVWLREGEAQGEAQGKAETLVRQLVHRFGLLSDDFPADIGDAAMDVVDRWLEAAHDVPTLDGGSLKKGTAAYAWFQEGKARGIVKGKSATLARQLARRFGRPLAEIRARIAGADLGQLNRWLIAVLDAPTYEAVFSSTPKR